MDEKVDRSVLTIDEMSSAMLNGLSPRDAGGEDARANRPPPQGDYMPPAIRNLHARGEEICHAATKRGRNECSELRSALGRSEFAVEGAANKAGGVLVSMKSEIDLYIEHNTPAIQDRTKRANETATTYARDLQAADTTAPRRGWQDPLMFWSLIWLFLCVEGAAAAIALWRALGPVSSFASGLFLAAISLLGGWAAARVVLRPTNHAQNTALMRAVQWTIASAIWLGIMFVLYLGACYREALIEGLNATGPELFAKLTSPKDVLSNFEVDALMFIGIAGFVASALETWTYYHGYQPLLRQSGLANEHAHAGVREFANELKHFVHRTAHAGATALDDIGRNNAVWLRSVADHGDAGRDVVFTVNGEIDVARRIFANEFAKYVDGYQEVRLFDRTSPPIYPAIGDKMELPELFAEARESAIASATQVSQVIAQGHLQIAAFATAAIIRIDELAGLRPPPDGKPLLPRGGNS